MMCISMGPTDPTEEVNKSSLNWPISTGGYM